MIHTLTRSPPYRALHRGRRNLDLWQCPVLPPSLWLHPHPCGHPPLQATRLLCVDMLLLTVEVLAERGTCCREEVMASATAPAVGIVRKLKGKEPFSIFHLRLTMTAMKVAVLLRSCNWYTTTAVGVSWSGFRVAHDQHAICGRIDASMNVSHWPKPAATQQTADQSATSMRGRRNRP